jgi:hypothetical protein
MIGEGWGLLLLLLLCWLHKGPRGPEARLRLESCEAEVWLVLGSPVMAAKHSQAVDSFIAAARVEVGATVAQQVQLSSRE